MDKKRRVTLRQLIKEELTQELRFKKMNLVTESTLNRILDKHYKSGFIIITSYRGGDEKTVEENNSDFKKLKEMVKTVGYSFIPVYGGFLEDKGLDTEREVREPALLVPNYKAGEDRLFDEDAEGLKRLGVKLAKRFNQDSFLFKPSGDNDTAHYIDKNGNVEMSFSNKRVNDMLSIYFTDLSKKFGGENNKTSKRFTFSESIFMDKSPKTISEAWSRYGEIFFSLK